MVLACPVEARTGWAKAFRGVYEGGWSGWGVCRDGAGYARCGADSASSVGRVGEVLILLKPLG